MKMTRNLLAVAALVLACGSASAANTPAQAIPDGAEVTVAQNGGMMEFIGPVNVTIEKAVGTKDNFSLTEGKKRSVYVARGDKVIVVPVRIGMPVKRTDKDKQKQKPQQ